MNSALAISACGIRTASTQLGTAAAQIVAAVTPQQTARPSGTAITPGRAGLSVMAMAYSDPAVPMVNMLEAGVSYRANIAAFKLADQATKSLLDMVA